MLVAGFSSMAKSRMKSTGQSAIAEPAGAPQTVGGETASASERDRIAERAYQLYEARGGGDGRDMDDWLQAERELAGQGYSGGER